MRQRLSKKIGRESAYCPRAVLVDTNKFVLFLFVMWKGPRPEIFGNPAPARGRVNLFQTSGQRLMSASFSQRESLWHPQQRFDSAPEAGPEFDLPSDGTLGRFREEPCLKDEIVG